MTRAKGGERRQRAGHPRQPTSIAHAGAVLVAWARGLTKGKKTGNEAAVVYGIDILSHRICASELPTRWLKQALLSSSQKPVDGDSKLTQAACQDHERGWQS